MTKLEDAKIVYTDTDWGICIETTTPISYNMKSSIIVMVRGEYYLLDSETNEKHIYLAYTRKCSRAVLISKWGNILIRGFTLFGGHI